LSSHERIIAERESLIREVIGSKIPRLWCPPLTHYTSSGALDKDRITAHWKSMRPNVGSFLIPGSTGDGWEMTEKEIITLLDFSIDLAQKYDALILIGVLKTEVSRMIEVLHQTMAFLKKKTRLYNSIEVLKKARVCGFTVCPPSGSGLTEAQIQEGLETVLDAGLPVALYQLPQVTENEMSPALVTRMAERYSNFLLLKDSGGNDGVALQDKGKSGIFLVRGAEGNYAEWLREVGGPYNGLLLSTANCFSSQLRTIIELLEKGEFEEAKELSARLTKVVNSVFDAVSTLDVGNPFTNANKAMDHFFAHGSKADQLQPPMLHAGVRLPADIIREVGELLRKSTMMSERGYVEK